MPDDLLARAREALIAAGITGPHRSHSKRNVLAKIDDVLAGDTDDTFGLGGLGRYRRDQMLSFMSRLTGCWSDVRDTQGFDEIDPDLTLDALVVAGRRLGELARSGALLFVATGHPTGMLEWYVRVADAYRDGGGKVVRLREGEELRGRRGKHHEMRYVAGVGCLSDWGSLLHTHSASPMEVLLEGGAWPDVVLSDHGFAGAAVERAIPTIAVMDINDVALAVAGAEDRVDVIVPLDDNRLPRLYKPAWEVTIAAMKGEL